MNSPKVWTWRVNNLSDSFSSYSNSNALSDRTNLCDNEQQISYSQRNGKNMQENNRNRTWVYTYLNMITKLLSTVCIADL